MSSSQATGNLGTKWIHFWLFGPEFGCVKRELPIIEALRRDYAVLLIVHQKHLSLLRQYFAPHEGRLEASPGTNVKVIAYPYGLSLEYDTAFNLRFYKSIFNIIKFVSYQWIKDFRTFQRSLKSYPPGVIVSDFLPYVALWAKIFKIPNIGVYNYALAYTTFGTSLLSKLLEWTVPKIYRLAYKLTDKMFVESLVTREIPNAVCIPVIRRYPEPSEFHESNKSYLIALGGKSDPTRTLEFFQSVRQHAPELEFWIMPREPDEFGDAVGDFRIANTQSPLSTFDAMQKVSGVITKAGLSTVAEALQLKKKLFIIMLTNHPEIQETATQLVALGLAKPISFAMAPAEVAQILTSPFAADSTLEFGGETIVINEIRKYLRGEPTEAQNSLV